MNEMSKTLVYLACALVAVIAGTLSRPADVEVSTDDLIGKPLFEEFNDSATASGLKIVEFDESEATKSTFEVARDTRTKAWTIPSHSKYPADADSQMRDAALALIDLKVLDVASQDASDHEMYGVIDPSEDLQASTTGVGKLCIVEGPGGDALAEIIIGKAIKDTPGQRFVRRRGQEPVYVVEIDPTKLPTEFSKWIERDLLQLTSFDIETFSLRDYSVIRSLQGFYIDKRLQIDTTNENNSAEWRLDQMLTFDRGQPIESSLLEEEKLNGDKLNDVKSALDQLEIVDVVRKPAGLGGDLKASEEFMKNQDNIDDLRKRGFYVLPIGPNREPLLTCANGEIHASTRTGVRYVLRFGETTDTLDAKGQLNRYLFVTAEVDPSKLPKPMLEPLPIASEGEEAPAADEDTKGFIRQGEPQVIADPDELAAARERITKDNARRVEEYNEKVKAAEDQAKKLQQRFGDWYYVISDDVYKRIHLGRADIIQERAGGAQQSFGVDALRALEDQGLQGAPAPAPPGLPGPQGLPIPPGR